MRKELYREMDSESLEITLHGPSYNGCLKKKLAGWKVIKLKYDLKCSNTLLGMAISPPP